MRSFLVFRRIDDGAAFEDAEFRVWCEELVQGTLWWRVEAAPEDARVLRIFFPPHVYEGMATHVDVEVPSMPKTGSIWRLRAPHNKAYELFRLESATEVTDSGLSEEERSMQPIR
ncbi:MAG: hypothetical protein IT371_20665 [Deltaproteobacteria bacterium]|nr:hypothetical protein [Deltaproteobacteria bacterium]